ncbi:hypothetical protein IFM89_025662 [Coptis chinensis]|uniref:cytokinin dehydrogenase n=1 Tax=Coptis chinensis TaxID=261450 RepID=A0A835H735_9MAGN|nr:hypothetical protein IFM89_025662 [Coptis chinensis]
MFLSCMTARINLGSKLPYTNSDILDFNPLDGPSTLRTLNLHGHFSFDDVHHAAKDFGNQYQYYPLAILRPKSVSDISTTIKHIFQMGPASKLTVAARGHGHSTQGQAQVHGGVVISMESLQRPDIQIYTEKLPYIDVSGGIRHGPQISNVYELEVVTGKGEVVNCSEKQNADLFYSVLGGLGQFGIITRARIALEPAPKMVKWIRVLYSDFLSFTNDQEHLISYKKTLDYIEGFVIINRTGILNNWRSSFNPQDPVQARAVQLRRKTLYCLEMTKSFNPEAKPIG